MKKFIIAAGLALAAGTILQAGPADKEIMQQAPAPCEWYRAHEWDLDLWGTFAISGNPGVDNRGRFLEPSDAHVPEDTGNPPGSQDPNEHTAYLQFGNDRFLDRDSTWGGGVDVKYFFSKYWALGLEGLVLDCQRNIGGGAFGTLTVRWPIGCSRFAPYAFGGFGVIAGGEHSDWFHNEIHHVHGSANGPVVIEHEYNAPDGIQNKHAEVAGQAGAGMEVRVTPRIGVMSDFAWNVVDGPDNNFGTARVGVTLSY